MPAEMMRRQKARPRESWLAVCLLSWARRELPRRIWRDPRRTKPDIGERRGQFLRIYDLKRGVSVMSRAPGILLIWCAAEVWA